MMMSMAWTNCQASKISRAMISSRVHSFFSCLRKILPDAGERMPPAAAAPPKQVPTARVGWTEPRVTTDRTGRCGSRPVCPRRLRPLRRCALAHCSEWPGVKRHADGVWCIFSCESNGGSHVKKIAKVTWLLQRNGLSSISWGHWLNSMPGNTVGHLVRMISTNHLAKARARTSAPARTARMFDLEDC